eukprot:Transcript_28447.p1 GENE.Transcript_28447~~Transcript_28447.p1  ORF type:complete len:429 (+),score=60.99 Transcript_28447:150-1436(+)
MLPPPTHHRTAQVATASYDLALLSSLLLGAAASKASPSMTEIEVSRLNLSPPSICSATTDCEPKTASRASRALEVSFEDINLDAAANTTAFDSWGLSEWLPPWSGRSLGTTRLATVFVAVGALPAIWRRREHGLSPRSGRSDLGARRVAIAALLLFSRGCSAATLCTFAGTDDLGNTVTAGSLCDGSWVGDSSYPTSLSLSNEGLSGTVPTELALLTQLTTLYLYTNDLSGTVPTELALLPQLNYLSLWSNDLSGTVPTEVGLMTKLDRLSLSSNSLSGSLPSEFGQLTTLDELWLHNNQFSGSLPSQIGQLTMLSDYLYLGYNQFSGSLPSSSRAWASTTTRLTARFRRSSPISRPTTATSAGPTPGSAPFRIRLWTPTASRATSPPTSRARLRQTRTRPSGPSSVASSERSPSWQWSSAASSRTRR